MESQLMRIDFEEQFSRLIKWFRIKGMTKDQGDVFYSKVNTFPLVGLMSAVDYFLESFKPTPSNFPTPKDIVNQVYQWLDQNPEERFKRTRYDTKEDFSYPIKKLWDGYEVLMRQGDDAFSQFALQSRMPANDQDRVRMKAKIVKENREADFKLETNKLLEAAGNKVPF